MPSRKKCSDDATVAVIQLHDITMPVERADTRLLTSTRTAIRIDASCLVPFENLIMRKADGLRPVRGRRGK